VYHDGGGRFKSDRAARGRHRGAHLAFARRVCGQSRPKVHAAADHHRIILIPAAP